MHSSVSLAGCSTPTYTFVLYNPLHKKVTARNKHTHINTSNDIIDLCNSFAQYYAQCSRAETVWVGALVTLVMVDSEQHERPNTKQLGN